MKTRKVVFMGLLIACSFVGANLTIFSTIAFDSMPGFLGALMLGPIYGGMIAALGHVLTSGIKGFPMGLPTHMITMVAMFIAAYSLGKVQLMISERYNKTIGVIVGAVLAVIINGPVALLMVSPITGMGIFALAPVLCIAALINVVLAQTVYLAIPMVIKNRYKELSKWR
jgi:hypothetical protein